MCGISGIINKNGKSVFKEAIKKINNIIAHRGPDGEGYYFGKNFTFGHRRLAIIDLSKAGHQPMHYDNKYVITYNGEIYNYLEIKEILMKEGFVFHSHTDTEVILASYDKWGFNCVNKFNGMWAFAIYDKEKELIFCSRDRFGVKPFYYTEVNEMFVFGSEIKQLLEMYSKRYANLTILLDYLIFGLEDHTNETFFENIYKLEQSHNLIYNIKTNTFKIERYYDITIDKNISKLSEDDSIKLYKTELERAVRLRLRSDVKVGSCLSGGLDSSSVATIASRLCHENGDNQFSAIHAKSIEDKTDESCYAKIITENADMELHVVEPKIEDFLSYIDEVIYTQEEPFGGFSIYMQYFVMQKAKEIGCKVMLDGQGGDETLLGYERYYPAYLRSLPLYRKITEFARSLKNSKLTIKELILYFIYFTVYQIRIRQCLKRYKFIKDKYLKLINKNTVKEISKSYKDILKLQLNEIKRVQMPHLLKYEDKNSMRNSIETRLPFIDYKILETALSLNNKFKIKHGWTKFILRRAINDILPESVAWRKNKFGFEAPERDIFKDSHFQELIKKEIYNSIILNEIIDGSYKNTILESFNDKITLWKLFNIARWEKKYNVQIKI
ncbi:MAG: asparagine synthase (glutamine-hydrolyzing) [Candidatus Jettenia sp.]|nr:asparagine synthase (glutamine-hydrolyzing) [Candidatus Jettenia sp.]